MSKELTIHHDLGYVIVKPSEKINSTRLKKMIRSTLDEYLEEELIPASVVQREIKEQIGDYYRTPGYYLRLYRNRADLTQAMLAGKTNIRQTHLSEMENNKRPIGKVLAKRLAKTLKFDYRKLL
ncbi:MAG: helix-turn-helix domain-containing protein [Thermodesulfobacteriota bacterium]